jgi:hypothetical protein
MPILRQYLLLAVLCGTSLPLAAADQPTGFAVVELFTSEGCSSCPSADRVLIELARRHERGEPIYCLGFHVDYWNKLGWTDGFSDASATRRQSAYAQRLELDQIYTPQMIVNGTTEFVGSNRKAADEAIRRALEQHPTHTVKLTTSPRNAARDLTVRYEITGPAEGHFVSFALVQRHGESQVTRGENEGRKLVHAGIVRAMQSAGLDQGLSSSVTLKSPDGVKASDLGIVGFVQNRATARIVGASQISVSP